MKTEEIYQFLRKHIGDYYVFSDEEWEDISSHFHVKKAKKHEFLIEQGQHTRDSFFIVSGIIKAYELDENGKEYIIQFARENYWVGDFAAIILGRAAILNIDCVEDCVVLVLSEKAKNDLCAKYIDFANFFRKKLERGFIYLQHRILSQMKDSAEERYNQFLQKSPELLQRIPKKMLAAYLGISKETLSRL